MGKNQSASGLTNIVQYDNDGNISLVSGSTTLLYISSSGAITTRGIISGSNALSASYAASASNAISGAYAVNATTASYAVASTTASYSLTGTSASYAVNATTASYAVVSTSASYATDATTASYAVASTNAANATLFNNTASSVFSTTGSNTLTGTQYVSNTNNATAFSNTTSSIYTDGGLQVTKDAYFSSSMFIKGNLTVFGTQSVSFITSSQLNISTNVITVNTNTPSIRFGGLSVYDSGSTGATGSIFWDSQNNHWIYTNPSGSSYSGGMLISGPRNTGSIGDEQGTTLNAIMKGMGGDHITSSVMFESASFVGIGTTSPQAKLDVRSSGLDTNVLSIYGTTGGAKMFDFRDDSASGTTAAMFRMYNSSGTETVRLFPGTVSAHHSWILPSGNLGIGTSDPAKKLDIYSSATSNTAQIVTSDASSTNRLYLGTFSNNSYISFGGTYQGGWSANGSNAIANIGMFAGSGASTIQFETSTSNGVGPTERMRITSAGNVGIGTTNPTGSLDVSGSVYIRSTGGGVLFIPRMVDPSRGLSIGEQTALGSKAATIRTAGGVSEHLFIDPGFNNSDVAGNIALAYANTGSVGIGTYLPYSKFHQVTWDATYSGDGRFGGSSTQFGIELKYNQASTTSGSIYCSPGYSSTGVLFKLGAGSGNTNQLVLKGDGNVGIGTSNPAGLFQVASLANTGGGMLYKNMNIAAGTATTFFTVNDIDGWCGFVEIFGLSIVDRNRVFYKLARFAYNRAWTEMISSEQNTATTSLGYSGNNLQITIGGTAGLAYYCMIRVVGSTL